MRIGGTFGVDEVMRRICTIERLSEREEAPALDFTPVPALGGEAIPRSSLILAVNP
jgi:hypothetical protein